MSRLLRFLGLGNASETERRSDSPALERIAEQLSHLPPERARFFAAFSYVLARVASADLRIEASEREKCREILTKVAGIDPETATLVAEIAHSQVHELGASSNYLVTRELRRTASRDEQIRLLDCLFAVAAADENVSGGESQEIMIIADELGIARADALAVRARFRDKLAEFRKLAFER